jgi:hypothetical protein
MQEATRKVMKGSCGSYMVEQREQGVRQLNSMMQWRFGRRSRENKRGQPGVYIGWWGGLLVAG